MTTKTTEDEPFSFDPLPFEQEQPESPLVEEKKHSQLGPFILAMFLSVFIVGASVVLTPIENLYTTFVAADWSFSLPNPFTVFQRMPKYFL